MNVPLGHVNITTLAIIDRHERSPRHHGAARMYDLWLFNFPLRSRPNNSSGIRIVSFLVLPRFARSQSARERRVAVSRHSLPQDGPLVFFHSNQRRTQFLGKELFVHYNAVCVPSTEESGV